jgi:hypothetical protein
VKNQRINVLAKGSCHKLSDQVQTEFVGSDAIWEDLVVSILAMNNCSLESAYGLLPRLRTAGIVNPKNLVNWELQEVVTRLEGSGFNRGIFMTNLFALRLVSLAAVLEEKGVAACGETILSNDRDAISRLLLPVHGIGPKVLRNFFLLRGFKD